MLIIAQRHRIEGLKRQQMTKWPELKNIYLKSSEEREKRHLGLGWSPKDFIDIIFELDFEE